MSSNYHDVSQGVGDQLIFAQHEQILIDWWTFLYVDLGYTSGNIF